jgi:general secretion pathway protein C
MHAIQKRFRSPRWLLDLAAFTLGAGMLGHAVAAFDQPAPRFVAIAAPKPRPGPPARTSGASVDRNIFCSSCGQAGPAVEAELVPMPLVIVAILRAAPPFDPAASLAVVRDTEARMLGIFGVGDRLRGSTIVDVGETRIGLSREGRLRYLDLLAPLPGQEPARSEGHPAPALDHGIRKLGERSYELDRAALEELIGNTPALMQGARIFPELREGQAAGFRFHAIRPDSPFARIGLQSGDLVLAVNGLPLTTAESGLEAFVKLRSASHVSLALERQGQRVTCEYRIR